MRTVSKIVLSALLAFPMSSVQAQSPAVAPHVGTVDKCNKFSQAGRHDCFRKSFVESTLTLKKAEADALGKIALWFENDRYKNIARTKMRAADAAFVRYREARCAFIVALRGAALPSATTTTSPGLLAWLT
ncbi:hypothetical protein [Massilia genomosp. 1]|uniref:Lysozyme inhibitor LprI N-terminal domain-containing protein n=1 Tax=Massilia genomosp. 1 TaxID=2609280 RepID=A0ABX0MKR2_9BURK|nr:hypothetical protein [Massilia genomosp. 1]NHZ63374.1 hypothetical protein [Massilia genomosp. 1]